MKNIKTTESTNTIIKKTIVGYNHNKNKSDRRKCLIYKGTFYVMRK